jgi:hypothetical protein
MPGEKTENNKAEASKGIEDCSLQTNVGELTNNETKNGGSKAEAMQQNVNSLAQSHENQMLQYITDWWESLKLAENSNRLIAAATIVIAVAAGFTWWEAHEGGGQTDRIIAADERIARGIENTVGQANKSFNASLETARTDQRAWVGVVKLNSFNFKTGPNYFIPFDIVNSGKTPALNVRTKATLKTLEKGTQFIPTYQPPTTVPSLSVVQPQMHMELTTLPIDISASQFANIKNGRGILYAYGDITYDDIFGKSHETTFCVMYWNGLTAPITCDTYNSAT